MPAPRRQGWSRSHLLRTLDNAGRQIPRKRGDGVSSAFPKGKQNEDMK